MAVLRVEEHRQLNGEDVLKVVLKPTQKFPEGYFYCDSCDEKLVRSYTWYLKSQKQLYVMADFENNYSRQHLHFHRGKAYNILDRYPDYINHINGVGYDNTNSNLDVVTSQQNNWCKVSRGYSIAGRSFEPHIKVNAHNICAKCTRTEAEACQSVYQLELQYEDYCYEFLKDRRKDIDILDLERTGQISEEEAVYRHVLRYAADNAWYVYRYNLFEYFRDNHLNVPDYAIDEEGYMTHSITGQRLCPL